MKVLFLLVVQGGEKLEEVSGVLWSVEGWRRVWILTFYNIVSEARLNAEKMNIQGEGE